MGRVSHVPQPHRAVDAAGGQGAPIRLNATELTALVWPVRGEPTGGVGRVADVPQPHCPVVAAAGQGVPIRTERHRVDGVGVAGQRGGESSIFRRDQGRVEIRSWSHAIGGKIKLRREGHSVLRSRSACAVIWLKTAVSRCACAVRRCWKANTEAVVTSTSRVDSTAMVRVRRRCSRSLTAWTCRPVASRNARAS